MPAKNESNTGDGKGWGLQFFIACAANKIEFNGVSYSRKEFTGYLDSSGLAEKIILAQQTDQESSFMRVWWAEIQQQAKLDRSGPRRRQATKVKQALFDWILENNIDPNLSLDKLMKLINQNMISPPARSTVHKYLPQLRKRK